MTTHPGYLLFLFLTSIVAGAMNALAGGGTILTFPALLAGGVSPVVANATNSVALVPGSLSAGWAFRRELGLESRPVLTALFILQEPVRRWRERRGGERQARELRDINLWVLAAGQFVVAVYGGFFGAAMGILMLAELGMVRLTNIHQMNGLGIGVYMLGQ